MGKGVLDGKWSMKGSVRALCLDPRMQDMAWLRIFVLEYPIHKIGYPRTVLDSWVLKMFLAQFCTISLVMFSLM